MEPTMKRNAAIFAPVFLLAVGAASLTTGCASTNSQASIGETVDDSVITTKVKALFVEDKTVSALNVKVETYKGTVQLSGFANSAAEVRRAGEIAASVKGVTAVKNQIALK
jgi:hyperosmotically inducible protein